jgi:hypothetical protein
VTTALRTLIYIDFGFPVKEVLARIFRERDWNEEDGVLILQEGNAYDHLARRLVIVARK